MQTESILRGVLAFHSGGVKPGDGAPLHHGVKAHFRLSAGSINPGRRRNGFDLTAHRVVRGHVELSADPLRLSPASA